jgi:AcrR family transcriptional regulator
MVLKIPRGRPRQFDESTALDTALRLFWRHGYEGTPISTLAQAMGLTVASVYNAFGNKESLFMKAVEHYDRYSESLYKEAFAKTSAREVALGILMGEVDLVSGEGTPEGCLMIQGALATSPESEAVKRWRDSGGRRKPMSPRGSSNSRRLVSCHRAGTRKRWPAM